MGAIRPTGKYQVAAEVSPGLYEAMQAHATAQGIPVSAIVRRALMHELGVDADGVPAKGGRK